MIPVFSTHYSIGRGILTCDDPMDVIDPLSSISIFSIGKKYQLKEIYLAETSFSGFIEAQKYSEKAGLDLRFGIKFIIATNAQDKSEDSRCTESKITVWMKNSDGYKDLIKLYSAIHAHEENFYYYCRGDWKIVKDHWTDNLLLTVPFYDSFLYKNLLEYGRCVPNLAKSPIFEVSEMGLPFDRLIRECVIKYILDSGYETLLTHPIYYYQKSDFLAYQTFRCIGNRSTINKPQLDHMSIDSFCWEEYCNRAGIEFKL
jgi:DNA polymerase III alpha subunit